MSSPTFNRRLDASASIQQPAYAGGGAGAALTVPCVTPVRIATRSAEKFKLATTFNMWETFVTFNEAVKPGQVLTVNGHEYVVKFTGEYDYGRTPVTQLILESQH